jgi:pilus assembly protein TadC
VTAFVLGVAWAALLALPVAGRAHRTRTGTRARALRPAPAAYRNARHGLRTAALGRRLRRSAVGRVLGAARSRVVHRRADVVVQRELPVALDLLGVAVGAGCTPYLAVEATVAWAPPVLAERFDRALDACRLGAAFTDALDGLGSSTPRLAPVVDALLTSDRLGAPVGPALARLADEERAAARRRAEAHARRVPVRLLFPLVFLVLPAFGFLTVVPALLSGLART